MYVWITWCSDVRYYKMIYSIEKLHSNRDSDSKAMTKGLENLKSMDLQKKNFKRIESVI